MDHGQNYRSKAASGATETAAAKGGRKEGFDSVRGRTYHGGITGVLGFLGLPGTGKTTLMLDKLWDCKHVIIYNTAGDFGNGTRGAGRPLKPLPGFRFIFSMSELAAYLLQAKQENWQKVRVCFTPLRNPAMEAEEVVIRGKKYPMKMALFITACDLVRDFGDCVFAVDEIWNFQNAAWSPDVLNELMLQWRHYGLTLAYTAQIPQKVDKTLLTVSTEIYCGRLNLENDLNAVRRNARIPEDAMRLLPNLPDWQFVHRFENGTWKLERP